MNGLTGELGSGNAVNSGKNRGARRTAETCTRTKMPAMASRGRFLRTTLLCVPAR